MIKFARSALSSASTLAVVATLALTATQAGAQEKKKLAFVVNASSDFWKLAEAGVKKAQGELPKYELQFKYPAQGTAALQNALMDDLVAAGTNAIMISSVDPKTSIDAFNRIAKQVPLFTTDSDAPASNRIAYLGSSNTLAGEQAGEVAVKALPKGAKCMGFVGFLGGRNGGRRSLAAGQIKRADIWRRRDRARAQSHIAGLNRGGPIAERECVDRGSDGALAKRDGIVAGGDRNGADGDGIRHCEPSQRARLSAEPAPR